MLSYVIYENLSNWHWSIPIGWIVYLFAVIFPVLISLWINQMIILSIIHFKVMLIAIKLETTWQRYKKTRLLANCAFISLNKRKKLSCWLTMLFYKCYCVPVQTLCHERTPTTMEKQQKRSCSGIMANWVLITI